MANRLVFMAYLPDGLTEEELQKDVEEVVWQGAEQQEEGEVEMREREEVVSMVRVWQTENTQAEVLFKEEKWARRFLRKAAEFEDKHIGCAVRAHKTQEERRGNSSTGFVKPTPRGVEEDVRYADVAIGKAAGDRAAVVNCGGGGE